MNIEFKINSPYTLVSISEWLAHTQRTEIIITRREESSGRYVFKKKGKRKEFYLPKPESLQEQLIFAGHNLPFVIDSETNRFIGNAQFNFVTEKPQELKAFIEQHCLNPSASNFSKILYRPPHIAGDSLVELALFPKAER